MTTVELYTIKKAGANLSLPKMRTYFGKLDMYAIGHDKALARLRWLQGDALIKAKKKCKRGEWGPFLKQIGIKPAMAGLIMKIAQTVVEARSMKMTFQEMFAMVNPSHAKRYFEAIAKAEGANGRRRNNKPKTKEITIEKLTADLKGMADTSRNLARGKHQLDMTSPAITIGALTSAKAAIDGIGRNLVRMDKLIDQRIADLESSTIQKRKAG